MDEEEKAEEYERLQKEMKSGKYRYVKKGVYTLRELKRMGVVPEGAEDKWVFEIPADKDKSQKEDSSDE